MLSLALAACGCATATPSGAGGATVSTTSAPAPSSVRDVDWASQAYPGLDLRGDDELGAPRYGDLTGDGREEAVLEGMAIVPDGNSYTTYVYVFSLPTGAAEPVLLEALMGGDRADGSIRVTGVDAAGLHLARAILGPDDAMCCPSTEQHETWTWNGTELVEDVSRRRVASTEE